MLESDVFNRRATSSKEISPGLYNLTIGLCLLWGFSVNWFLVVNIDPQTLWAINPWVFFIGYFASCFVGVWLFNESEKPVVSFLGYNLVVVPFGLIVNMVVAQYNEVLVIEAIRLTASVTLIMMLLGSMFPRFFQRILGVLSIALLAVLVVELFQIFVLGIHHEWIDWAVAVIFCGYIGYDWGRANQIPKTLDNAVDSAAALYMDIINLFLRILRILGRKQ
ncbi:Bax inhibitor-1 family protein [Pseudoalteromonas sp. BDTF-M6]|uniref:Bax inhibitor-1 family protein n=1 Tax=Pseudoalteromonas sp. BDTF-M6 TaxID=2796132 RepID=UPI001BB0304C|nr:Bax inhibitor-1 family protein [Pseudoalteromonas sp. BDTF-M6]MBS3799147.1 US12 family protein [Pseudoalteromonas sp. BDTF-M6]